MIYDCSDLIGQTVNTINHFLIQSTHITFTSYTFRQFFCAKLSKYSENQNEFPLIYRKNTQTRNTCGPKKIELS